MYTYNKERKDFLREYKKDQGQTRHAIGVTNGKEIIPIWDYNKKFNCLFKFMVGNWFK